MRPVFLRVHLTPHGRPINTLLSRVLTQPRDRAVYRSVLERVRQGVLVLRSKHVPTDDIYYILRGHLGLGVG